LGRAGLEVEPGATAAERGAKGGRGKKAIDNVNSFSGKGGNSALYTLKRLKRDRRSKAFQSDNVKLKNKGGRFGIYAHGHRGGRGKKASDNVTSFRGTSVLYTLKRLKRDRPDLFQQVIGGKLSANAAAIQAGFRKQTTPIERIQKLWAKLSRDERKQHLEWTLRHCAQCGRVGATNGDWCDVCCDRDVFETSPDLPSVPFQQRFEIRAGALKGVAGQMQAFLQPPIGFVGFDLLVSARHFQIPGQLL
jgi:hypothetical protein